MWVIFRKELRVYFHSLLGYILMFIFLAIAGMIFLSYYVFTDQSLGDFSPLFTMMNSVFLFIMPLLTFRLLVEEKREGSYELLLTSPVSSWDIIIGKFLAVLIFSMMGATLVLLFPLLYSVAGKVYWSTLISGYIGLIFSFSFFLSIGMAASAMTEDYVIAGLLSFGIAFLLFVMTLVSQKLTGIPANIFKELSYSTHYGKISGGIAGVKNFLYFIFGTILWLYLSKTMVESKTWN